MINIQFYNLFDLPPYAKYYPTPSVDHSTYHMYYCVWASHVVLVVKNLLPNAGDARDAGLIPRSRRSPGGGHGNPLKYSCLENPRGPRSLSGYSPWGCKELDRTERLSTAQVLRLGTRDSMTAMWLIYYLNCYQFSWPNCCSVTTRSHPFNC